MKSIRHTLPGILFWAAFAAIAWYAGQTFSIIGGPVFGILIGIILSALIRQRDKVQAGILFTSEKVLQYVVILPGFSLNPVCCHRNRPSVTGDKSLQLLPYFKGGFYES